MRKLLISVTSLMLLGAVLVSGSTALETGPTPVTTPDGVYAEGAMPPLEGGAPYDLPVLPSPTDQPGVPDGTADALTIDIWYGPNQSFGELGTPQMWLNVLGAVSGPQPIESLTYSLNGGPERPLSVGSDDMRLYRAGDFNIELDVTEVNALPATNTVVITADDGQTIVQETVIVTYRSDTVWPLPYTADWSSARSIADAAQAVDGLWRIEDGGLENVYPGFDRLVALGDMSWTDYEVTVPVTVHTLNSGEWTGPSNGGGVGIIVRWPGHYSIADEQPRLGWRHLGALGWYHWGPKGDAAFELRGEGGRILDTRSDQKIRLETPYLFKLRVESLNGSASPATYSFKFWEAGTTEPAGWTLQSVGRAGEPQSGSVVLVAHQSEVTFGNPTVLPLNDDGLRVTVRPSSFGSVLVTPQKAVYQPGETVAFVATPEPGYRFAGWSGDLAGTDNPLSVVLSQDLTVEATFEPETYRIYMSPVVSGSFNGLALLPGDVLALDSSGTWAHVLSAAAGPLGKASDVEAFTFLPDGSLLVAPSANVVISGFGTARPSDVLRLTPDALGGFDMSQPEWYLDGSDVGLTTTGERIDALAVGPDGRLLVSIVGSGRVAGPGGESVVVRDEDVIAFTGGSFGESTAGAWDLVCDGSQVPGLADEDIVGLSVDTATGNLLISVSNGFLVAGIKGTSRDVLSLSGCDQDATAGIKWNSRSTGFLKPFDAIEFAE